MLDMAKRLHQVVVTEQGIQSDTERVVEQYQRLFALGGEQNPMKGLVRTYQPLREGGVTHPAQSAKVQIRAADVLPEIKTALGKLFDVKFTREYWNCRAAADLVVDGETLLTGVPATYFLFLEREVSKIRSGLVAKLPVLDSSEDWHWDPARGIYVTEPRVTESTAKVPQVHVLSPAQVIDGQKFDPQVRAWDADEKVGEWTNVKLSGQLPADDVKAMYDRCSRLLVAIKQAREAANSIEIEEKDAGPVLDYIFG